MQYRSQCAAVNMMLVWLAPVLIGIVDGRRCLVEEAAPQVESWRRRLVEDQNLATPPPAPNDGGGAGGGGGPGRRLQPNHGNSDPCNNGICPIKLAYTEHRVERLATQLVANIIEDLLHIPVELVTTDSLSDPYESMRQGVYDVHMTSRWAAIDFNAAADKFGLAVSEEVGHLVDAGDIGFLYSEGLFINPREEPYHLQAFIGNQLPYENWVWHPVSEQFLNSAITIPTAFQPLAEFPPDPAACAADTADGRDRTFCVNGTFVPPICQNPSQTSFKDQFIWANTTVCGVIYKDYPGTGVSAFEWMILAFGMPYEIHYIGDKLRNLSDVAGDRQFLAYGYTPSDLKYANVDPDNPSRQAAAQVQFWSQIQYCAICYVSPEQLQEYGGVNGDVLAHCGRIASGDPYEDVSFQCSLASVEMRKLYTKEIEQPSKWPAVAFVIQMFQLQEHEVRELAEFTSTSDRADQDLMLSLNASVEHTQACQYFAAFLDPWKEILEAFACTLGTQGALTQGSVFADALGGSRCTCFSGEYFNGSRCTPCPADSICPGQWYLDKLSEPKLWKNSDAAGLVDPDLTGLLVDDTFHIQCPDFSEVHDVNAIANRPFLGDWTVGPSLFADCQCMPGYTAAREFEAESANATPGLFVEFGPFYPVPIACVTCPHGYFKANLGIGSCDNRCPTRSGTARGAKKLDDCKCLSESYLMKHSFDQSTWECQPCEDLVGHAGALCLSLGREFGSYDPAFPWGPDPTLLNFTWNGHAMPRAAQGWHMVSAGSPDLPDGFRVAFWLCRYREACLGNNVCAEGYEGVICYRCQKGYGRSLSNTNCVVCTAQVAWAAFSIMTLLVVVLAILMAHEIMRTMREEDAALGILMIILLQHNYVGGYVIFLPECPDGIKSFNLVARARLAFSCVMDSLDIMNSGARISCLSIYALFIFTFINLLICYLIQKLGHLRKAADIELSQHIVDELGYAVDWLQKLQVLTQREDTNKLTLLVDLEKMQEQEITRHRVLGIFRTVNMPGDSAVECFIEDCMSCLFFQLWVAYQVLLPTIMAEICFAVHPLDGQGEINISLRTATELEQEFLGTEHLPHFIHLFAVFLLFGGGYLLFAIYVVKKYALQTQNPIALQRYGFFWMGAKTWFPQRYWIVYLMAQGAVVGVARESVVFPNETSNAVSMIVAMIGALIHASLNPIQKEEGRLLHLCSDLALASWCLTVVALRLRDATESRETIGEGFLEFLDWVCITLYISVYIVGVFEVLLVARSRLLMKVERLMALCRFKKGRREHPALPDSGEALDADETNVADPEREWEELQKQGIVDNVFLSGILWGAHTAHHWARSRSSRISVTSRNIVHKKEHVEPKMLNEFRVVEGLPRAIEKEKKERAKNASKKVVSSRNISGRFSHFRSGQGLKSMSLSVPKSPSISRIMAMPSLATSSAGLNKATSSATTTAIQQNLKVEQLHNSNTQQLTRGLTRDGKAVDVPQLQWQDAGTPTMLEFMNAFIELMLTYFVIHCKEVAPYSIMEFLIYDAIDYMHHRRYIESLLLDEISRYCLMRVNRDEDILANLHNSNKMMHRYPNIVKLVSGRGAEHTPTLLAQLKRLLSFEDRLGSAMAALSSKGAELRAGDLTMQELHRYTVHVKRSRPEEYTWLLMKFAEAVDQKRRKGNQVWKRMHQISVACQTNVLVDAAVQTTATQDAQTFCTSEMLTIEQGVYDVATPQEDPASFRDDANDLQRQVVMQRQEAACAEREVELLKEEVKKMLAFQLSHEKGSAHKAMMGLNEMFQRVTGVSWRESSGDSMPPMSTQGVQTQASQRRGRQIATQTANRALLI